MVGLYFLTLKLLLIIDIMCVALSCFCAASKIKIDENSPFKENNHFLWPYV